ncbi:hypothetical protein P170DRAFT_384015 [Aspergillus steynii IBT 23096]|uniref:F-box domain-containing protein n=1 Tax=Aspergillus steynii IBT 23096 TaxID=1392250 RepID=A0A2I2G8S1_9EURO|nr:uncharacterized protein P170DRAFT_384015 [Aspergillus steynii IBT 23096]PLB49275.1 hypothetical protein P170DRAFT_384015 [Aspergillus steynii IBT 23096]
MGGWDVYCAICASNFKKRIVADSDDESKNTYSADVIGESDTTWLGKVHGLGFNRDASGDRKSFLTGSGRYSDYGILSLEPGDDPNVPAHSDEEMIDFVAYDDPDGNQQPVFPVHATCYQDILPRCFNDTKQKINGDVLYTLFEEIVASNRMNRLDLDYGEPKPTKGQYWESKKGEEVLVTNPVQIPQLPEYLGKAQTIATKTKESKPENPPSTVDIFDKLPSELRLEILNLLPTASALALKTASWTMLKAPLSWRQKLASDMPWLWEFRDLEVDMCRSGKLNSELSQVVSELNEKSRYSKDQTGYIPGLVNRRRIWGVCENLRSMYMDKLEAKKDSSTQ